MIIKKTNILGTQYTISFVERSKDNLLKKSDGYCDYTNKKIVVCDISNEKENYEVENLNYLTKKILRHELIHAFLFESGLAHNSNDVESWAVNEEMVDWISFQFSKMYKVFKELDCMEE